MTATNVSQLILPLSAEGLVLHNPVPIDRRLPCYRVANPPVFHGALIEETDNVMDDHLRVWSMADGTVIVTRKDERRAVQF